MISLAGLMACNPKSDFEMSDQLLSNIPDSVVNVDEMISIMTDIHLAEAWVIEQPNDSIPNDTKLSAYYADIFANHNISAQQYKSSFNFYTGEPVLMNYIYQKITEKLNLLESENRNLNKTKNTDLKNEQESK